MLLLAFLLSEVGSLTDLPAWLLDASPFTYLSTLPVTAFEPVPALVLTGVALGLMALGGLAYRRRDAARAGLSR